jgi:hypothetical protein
MGNWQVQADGSLRATIMTPWHKELQSFANNLQTYTVYMARWAAASRSTSEKRFRALAIYLLLKGGEDPLSNEFSWYNSVIRRTEIEAVRHCMRACATTDPFSFLEVSERVRVRACCWRASRDCLHSVRMDGRRVTITLINQYLAIKIDASISDLLALTI